MPFSDLPQILKKLDLGVSYLTLLDAASLASLYYPIFSPENPALIFDVVPGGQAIEIQALLLKVYPKAHSCIVLQTSDSTKQEWNKKTILMKEIAGIKTKSNFYIPPALPNSSLESFQNLIARLRSPEGCPWDREQTHQTLRPNLLEETYEVLKTLDEQDNAGLMEELGDLLLQIVLHSQISNEEGDFILAQVIQGIHKKIVHRHPHVFKEVRIDNAKGVIRKWEELKSIERIENGKKEDQGILDSVPKMMPSLSLAQEYQKRAARIGFDWLEIKPVVDKIYEELAEIESAPTKSRKEEELGDLMFAVVNLVRWHEVDAESALRKMTTRFYNRFAYIEENTRRQGRKLQEMKLEELDAIWEEAKKNGL